ncbi:MAG: nucleotide sugar dehydrogenase [Halothiobacillaceae bacterium]
MTPPFTNENPRIAVVGLGYVGLPLAVAFARQFDVIGHDQDEQRIRELQAGRDRTREVPDATLESVSDRLRLTADPGGLADADVYIVAVPTPVDDYRIPDLGPLLGAAETVGRVLRPGTTVIFESTVWPGCTEETCVPVLERMSGLTYNRDFFVGYSPERINPGDPNRRFEDIVKVTAGSTPQAARFIDGLYARVVTAGTHLAPSLAAAEAAKVIENTQRDVNIALINELATLFAQLGLDTGDVLAAAGTKWNFLPFQPGLVGGHCIGVDPYYLTHKAQQIGFHPEMILAGRRINDHMGRHVAERVVKRLARQGGRIGDGRALVLGLTFKENCPDLRNTQAIEVVRELREYGMAVDVHDPWADPDQARAHYGIELIPAPEAARYDAIVLTVAHADFKRFDATTLQRMRQPTSVIFDVRRFLPREAVDERL